MSRAFPSYLQLDALGCTYTFHCTKHANGRISLYHIYCLLRNSTTIEGWEKDKAALMVKKGKLHTVCIQPFLRSFDRLLLFVRWSSLMWAHQQIWFTFIIWHLSAGLGNEKEYRDCSWPQSPILVLAPTSSRQRPEVRTFQTRWWVVQSQCRLKVETASTDCQSFLACGKFLVYEKYSSPYAILSSINSLYS